MNDSLRENEFKGCVGVLQACEGRGEERAVVQSQPRVRADALYGVGEQVQWRQVEAFGDGEAVQPCQDGGDLRSARELLTVIRDGLPERDHVAVGDDRWSTSMADCRIIDGCEPAGDGNGAVDGPSVGSGRDPGYGWGLEPVDRIGTQAEQSGAAGVQADHAARQLECALRAIHDADGQRTVTTTESAMASQEWSIPGPHTR